jgi:hypothetical protein
MRTLLRLTAAAALLTGCPANETGSYRMDDVLLVSASCAAGVDLERATVFTDAMSAAGPDDLLVTRGGVVSQAPSQAQFFRADGSVFFADVEETDEDRVFSGTRVAVATTVEDGFLGSDFSVLLQQDDIGCEFDLSVHIDFNFGEDGWDIATGSVIVEVAETAELSDQRCDISSCTAEWRWAARHRSGASADRLGDGEDE